MPNALECVKSRAALGHHYDPTSGWCVHGCGVRDDGYVVSRRGELLRIPRRKTNGLMKEQQ